MNGLKEKWNENWNDFITKKRQGEDRLLYLISLDDNTKERIEHFRLLSTKWRITQNINGEILRQCTVDFTFEERVFTVSGWIRKSDSEYILYKLPDQFINELPLSEQEILKEFFVEFITLEMINDIERSGRVDFI